jgi:hypothetical protein
MKCEQTVCESHRLRLKTLMRLGVRNVLRVFFYRVALKLRIHPVLWISAEKTSGPYFAPSGSQAAMPAATEHWHKEAEYFSCHHFPLRDLPDWYANPFLPGARADSKNPWWLIADFNGAVGDIKAVWEASRFSWAVAMAQRAAKGDASELVRLNAWTQDWVDRNPPYRGANWKCGQEASIRAMHLAAAALILDQLEKPPAALLALIKLHLRRIAPTMGYALGQQNNHGTSEAAALFIGGSWLAAQGDAQGEGWQRKGRGWLEERASALIDGDGTFSQYSVNYHRLMLDTFSLAEVWRRSLRLPSFSQQTYERMAAATRWLQQFTDQQTGHAPNVGANDGALLLPLTSCAYQDFRPSLQLASALFCNARGIADAGPWNDALAWLGVDLPRELLPDPAIAIFRHGGFCILRKGAAVAFLRFPAFQFRPSQSDFLHVDLWVAGKNILCDAGSYSYADDAAVQYYSGVASHNTVQFGSRDQMPRLGRFLFGEWPSAVCVPELKEDGEAASIAFFYTDWHGACHERRLVLSENSLVCTDRLSGSKENAVLRWRLPRAWWTLSGSNVSTETLSLRVEGQEAGVQLAIADGCKSLHYLQEEAVSVLEARTPVPNTVTTHIRF